MTASLLVQVPGGWIDAASIFGVDVVRATNPRNGDDEWMVTWSERDDHHRHVISRHSGESDAQAAADAFAARVNAARSNRDESGNMRDVAITQWRDEAQLLRGHLNGVREIVRQITLRQWEVICDTRRKVAITMEDLNRWRDDAGLERLPPPNALVPRSTGHAQQPPIAGSGA